MSIYRIIGYITITVLINIYHITHIFILYKNKKPVTKPTQKTLAIVSNCGKIKMSLQAEGLVKGAVYQFQTATD